MKVIIKDFDYRGHHFDRCEFEFPQLKDVDEAISDRFLIYISDTLDEFVKNREES